MREWKKEILKRLATLKLPPAREAEIVEELGQHLEDRYQELRAGGAGEDEARRIALAELSGEAGCSGDVPIAASKESGGEDAAATANELAPGLRRVEQESPQEPAVEGGARGQNFLSTAWRDIRYGFRQLRRNPGFAAVAVLTLALGIGANTAMFSIVDGAFLRPLPIAQPDQFLVISMRDSHGVYSEVSYPDFQDLLAQSASLAGAVAYDRETRFVNSMEESSLAAVDVVSLNYFDVLGVKPVLGRAFSSKERASTATEPVVVISYRLWKNRLGGDPAVVGKTIKLSNQPVTILGVGPPRFRGLERFVPTDIWMPADAFDPASMTARAGRYYEVVGRMKPGVTPERIQAELDTIGRRLAQTYQATNKALTFVEEPKDKGSILVSLLLMSLVGLVLLISCANVAGLLLARAESRSREIALRLALGASRQRLVRQLLTEGLMLSLAGGLLGLVLAARLIAIEPSLMPPAPIQIGPDLQIDARALLVTLAVSLLATLIFGLAPSFRASRPDLTGALKGEGTGLAGGSSRLTAGNVVVVGQVALAVLMLSVAGLFLRSLMSIYRVPLGFNPHKNLLVVPVGLPGAGAEEETRFVSRVLERVRALPGVVRAARAMRLPLSGSGGGAEMRISIPGIDLPEGQQTVAVKYNAVDPDYFQTVGTRLLKGRYFNSADNAKAPKVVLVSQTMARLFWPSQDPIGRSLRIEKQDDTVVGIVEDVKIIHIQEPPQPYMYFPMAQTSRAGELIVETAGEPRLWIPAVKQAAQALDKSALIVWIQTGESTFRSDDSVYTQRMASGMVGGLSLLAIFLASVGLYGVVAYVVKRRTREIGIRVALGAGRKQVMKLVLRQGLNLILVGILFGLVLAVATTRLIASALYGVSPLDPIALLGGAVLASVIALAACYIPARRAAKVDPMVALRYE